MRGKAREREFQETDSRAYLRSKTVQPMGGSSNSGRLPDKDGHSPLVAACLRVRTDKEIINNVGGGWIEGIRVDVKIVVIAILLKNPLFTKIRDDEND